MMQLTLAPTTRAQEEKPQACCIGQKPHESRRIDHEDHRHHEQHEHGGHRIHDGHHGAGHEAASFNRTAFMATVHCLMGYSIGEVLGMVIGTAFGWSNWPTMALAVVLAFLFGYGMTLWPLWRTRIAWGTALG